MTDVGASLLHMYVYKGPRPGASAVPFLVSEQLMRIVECNRANHVRDIGPVSRPVR